MRQYGKFNDQPSCGASAYAAAASFTRFSKSAAFCNTALHSLDAGLLASVLFVLTVLVVLGRGVRAALALIPVSILRIITMIRDHRPGSWSACFC